MEKLSTYGDKLLVTLQTLPHREIAMHLYAICRGSWMENVEKLSTFCVDNSLGSCKRERTEKIRAESLELLNKIHIIRRSKDA